MKKSSILFVFLLIVFTFVCFSYFAQKSSAQSYDPIQSGDIQQQVTLDVTPTNPNPGDTVTFTLAAYGTDLNADSISWSVNGKVVQQDTGLTTFSVTAGDKGVVQNVSADITPSDGSPDIIKTASVSSQEVPIIYEASGYTPPFYKGKAIFTKEGDITFIAMPNLFTPSGASVNPKNLIYKWTIDGTVQGSLSGYGKNTLSYTEDILGKDVLVQVDVSSLDGSITGTGSMLVSPEEPEMMFYEKNPLYGTLFNTELGANDFQMTDSEVTVGAYPYYASAVLKSDPTLKYSWSINGNPIAQAENQNYATFRNSTNQKGSSVIEAILENSARILQGATGSVKINF